jgi:hypothetical protein
MLFARLFPFDIIEPQLSDATFFSCGSSWRAVAFSAGGDGVANPHERGVIADDLLSSLGIMRAAADALEAMLWMWTLDFWHHEHRTPATRPPREAAMAAFARSWRHE